MVWGDPLAAFDVTVVAPRDPRRRRNSTAVGRGAAGAKAGQDTAYARRVTRSAGDSVGTWDTTTTATTTGNGMVLDVLLIAIIVVIIIAILLARKGGAELSGLRYTTGFSYNLEREVSSACLC
ncbi:hypothetical protein GE09DRAFT_1228408 [Coniochaeta sp. 2T2.1]|nr:hypothetical protein GE09DRAFT_1228408 [Coniochaeta sp. 2T2.1]